jgi:hypothetical protein
MRVSVYAAEKACNYDSQPESGNGAGCSQLTSLLYSLLGNVM